jgi:hypothetical protein
MPCATLGTPPHESLLKSSPPSPWELYTSQISSHPPPYLMWHTDNMTKIGIKYNQKCATSDHATIRRSTMNPETSLPEFTKTIVLQKIKAYEEKQSAGERPPAAVRRARHIRANALLTTEPPPPVKRGSPSHGRSDYSSPQQKP